MVHIVQRVSRQIQGEYILVSPLKAFKTPEAAQAYAESLKAEHSKPLIITTEHGDIPCWCELGVFSIPLED